MLKKFKLSVLMLLISIGKLYSFQESEKKVYSNSIPIIGIMSYGTSKSSQFPPGSTYIYSSYYKWIEVNNMKWYPISVYDSSESFMATLEKLNGFLLPGGAEKIHDNEGIPTIYYQKVKLLIEFSNLKKKQNIIFPIIGTCLGSQALLIALSNNEIQLKKVDNVNKSHFLNIKLDAFNSFLNLVFDKNEIAKFSTEKYFYFHHVHGFSKTDLESSEYFNKNISALAYISLENEKADILAAFQHNYLPIIAWQFHPEKVVFDQNDKQMIDKSDISIFFNSKFAKIFRLLISDQQSKLDDNAIFEKKNSAAFSFNYGLNPQESIILPFLGLPSSLKD